MIPDYNVIVAGRDDKYTLINSSGEMLFGLVADDIYMTISGGERHYYITVNDNLIDAEEYLQSRGIRKQNSSSSASNNSNITNVEDFKSWLQQKNSAGNPVYAFYKSAIPSKLACTPEQSAVLEELSNLELFDGTNNIITAEDIALLKLKYSLDVETYVDNKIEEKLANINQQILEIVGGN